ncbi:hypothetical protein PLICRDRAFT_96811 [Plicaturopsis crispa FD-325 SS-3]|nr:hypothetical protein PLICRDRAFT_96811 [Plicaturopsis crispa FD-325 SS-3]
MVSNPLQYFFLVLPPVLITVYFLAQFPGAPESLPLVYPSLASLPLESPSWSIYPEDFYPGGAYLQLPYGRMRYWLMGPEDGKKIVLIHGLSVPAIMWKDVAPTLAARGFRVLLYDLYGRGYSDAPATTYTTPLFTTQLALLMQHIHWDRAHVAGVSMGGAIAVAFARDYPDLVEDRVALIACAGLLESADISRTNKFMSSPLVQTATSIAPFRVRTVLVYIPSPQLYLQHLAASNATAPDSKSPEAAQFDSIAHIVRIQSAHLPGYNHALASSLRSGPPRGLASAFKQLGESGRKVLLIHGTEDNQVPYKYTAAIRALVPGAELVTVDGGPHDLTISHPDVVNKALVTFFGGV